MTSPTVPPSFERCDVLAALVFMGEETGVLSRATLMRRLSLKEGPAKTLLRRLEQNALVARVGNLGHVLTTEGKQWNQKIRELIVAHKEVQVPSISLAESAYGIQLRGMAIHVESGMEQRDHAFLVGAVGATTLVFQGGALKVPSVAQKTLDRKTVRELLSEFELQEGDILIIGMGRNHSDAVRGAFNAALSLLAKAKKPLTLGRP